MELDLSKRTFVIEFGGERITLDKNIGDFQYSPIIIFDGVAPPVNLL